MIEFAGDTYSDLLKHNISGSLDILAFMTDEEGESVDKVISYTHGVKDRMVPVLKFSSDVNEYLTGVITKHIEVMDELDDLYALGDRSILPQLRAMVYGCTRLIGTPDAAEFVVYLTVLHKIYNGLDENIEIIIDHLPRMIGVNLDAFHNYNVLAMHISKGTHKLEHFLKAEMQPDDIKNCKDFLRNKLN